MNMALPIHESHVKADALNIAINEINGQLAALYALRDADETDVLQLLNRTNDVGWAADRFQKAIFRAVRNENFTAYIEAEAKRLQSELQAKMVEYNALFVATMLDVTLTVE